MRLTINKQGNDYDYTTNELELVRKLGQLEDLMDKYGFETVEDLDNFIQSVIIRIKYENKKEKYL